MNDQFYQTIDFMNEYFFFPMKSFDLGGGGA